MKASAPIVVLCLLLSGCTLRQSAGQRAMVDAMLSSGPPAQGM